MLPALSKQKTTEPLGNSKNRKDSRAASVKLDFGKLDLGKLFFVEKSADFTVI